MMRRPLVCNSTSYNNVDYRKPISVHKSTDYRTSTGTYHRFIPPVGQDFDARMKTKRGRIDNPVFKSDFYLSDHHRNYCSKAVVKDPLSLEAPQGLQKVHYMRSLQEKLFKNPVAPIKPPKTEFKEEYYKKSPFFNKREVFPPNPYSACDIKAFGRDEQPPFRPEDNGYHKNLDIYLTTTRASYVPYDQKKQQGIARKDIITYYDATGVPKGGKGFGPRDESKFKSGLITRVKCPEKKLDERIHSRRLFISAPFKGKSECKDEFICPTFSNIWPFLFDSGVEYKDVCTGVNSRGALSAPAMYCSENKHYGSRTPVCAVIESKPPIKEYTHKLKEYCDYWG